MKYLTNEQVLEKNKGIRDHCASWLLEVVSQRQEHMIEKGRAQSLVQMYNCACQEIKRCEEIAEARESNKHGAMYVFKRPDADADSAEA